MWRHVDDVLADDLSDHRASHDEIEQVETDRDPRRLEREDRLLAPAYGFHDAMANGTYIGHRTCENPEYR
jgi:hypothetical protein